MTALPDLSPQFLESLSHLHNIDTTALIRSLDTPPAVGIRINRRKLADDHHDLYQGMSPISWSQGGFYLPERPNFTLNPLLHAGAFYVQDPSSMIYGQAVSRIASLLGDKPLSVLDFCAAPGGKTTAMIDALPDNTRIVANEYVASRGKILRENLEKWGFPSVITTGADSKSFSKLPPVFDIIAIDAPCSGEGMMRKDPDARSQWSEHLVESCAALQRSIIDDIAHLVRPGGYLLYSTCTFNLDENERNALHIIHNHGFESISPESLGLQKIFSEDCIGGAPAESLLPDVHALRFMPHLTDGEGLFLSIFRRTSQETDIYRDIPVQNRKKESGSSCKSGQKSPAIPKDASDAVLKWFLPECDIQLLCADRIITALPASMLPLHKLLNDYDVRITGAGLPVAELKGKTLLPDSRLALNCAFRRDSFPTAELPLDKALAYLRRESFTLPDSIPQGFVVVTFQSVPLGMMKNLGNRANNLLPQAWRIRNC